MFKKILPFLLCCLLLFSCGSSSDTDSSAGSSANRDNPALTEEPAPTEAPDYTGKTTLTYIGHASVKLVSKNGTVVYIDPHSEGDYSAEADIILVTHGHDDHSPNKDVKLKEGGTKITWKEALHDEIYETFDFGDVKIETVPSGGNPSHSVKSCVGYIVTIDGISVYHAGDTSMTENKADLTAKGLDYAMYPIDGEYNMDAAEATEVANLVAAKHNIPIHEYDTPRSKKSDNFTPDGRLVLEYGETIVIGE